MKEFTKKVIYTCLMIVIAVIVSIVAAIIVMETTIDVSCGVQFESVNATGVSGEVTMQYVDLADLIGAPSNCYWTQINVGTIGNEFVCEGGVRIYPDNNVTQVFMTVFDKGQGSTIASRDMPNGNCTIRLERSTEDLKTWNMYVNSKLFYSYRYSKIWMGSPNSLLETRSNFKTGQAGLQICSWTNIRQKATWDAWENVTYRGISGFGDINAQVTVTSAASYIVCVTK